MNLGKYVRRKFFLAVFKCKRIIQTWFGVRRLDYPKQELFLLTDTIREYNTRARSVQKEPKTVSWIEQNGGKNAVLYDVGANVGAYTLIAATLGTKVVAFEPAYQNVYKLYKNLELNSLEDHVVIVPHILADMEGIVQCTQHDRSFGSSQSFQTEKNEFGSAKKLNNSHFFLTTRLDMCMKIFLLPTPTFMKIDVDGAETEVLSGARQLLQSKELRHVLLETSYNDLVSVREILLSAGFKQVDEEQLDVHTINCIFERV